MIFIIFAPGGVAGLIRQVGSSGPTWWQEWRSRVGGWSSVARLARRRVEPDAEAAADGRQDPEDETRH
jgi:hypothetical protein